MSKQPSWNCDYVQRPHVWKLDDNQSATGNAGLRVYCVNCPQTDTLYAPYSKGYLRNAVCFVEATLS